MKALSNYIVHLGALKGVQASYTPILIEMMKRATEDIDGGFMIFLNKVLKKEIGDSCKVSLGHVDHAITAFVKAEYVERVGTGTYLLNKELFGEYRNINKDDEIIVTINYNTNQIKIKEN